MRLYRGVVLWRFSEVIAGFRCFVLGGNEVSFGFVVLVSILFIYRIRFYFLSRRET